MATMHNPPHPGELIKETMEALDVSARKLALALDVAPSTVQRLISGKSDISPEMAIRLAAVIGSSERVWMGMQDAYDLWVARQHVDLKQVGKLLLQHAVAAVCDGLLQRLVLVAVVAGGHVPKLRDQFCIFNLLYYAWVLDCFYGW